MIVCPVIAHIPVDNEVIGAIYFPIAPTTFADSLYRNWMRGSLL